MAVTLAGWLQVLQALLPPGRALMGGRLLRTLAYTRIAGVQNVSVNGGAPSTVGAGTYTRSALAVRAFVEAQGGGGAGGGGVNPTAGNVGLGAPGASGSYGSGFYDAATIGASQAVVVGLGGASVVGAAGGNGGTSSLGALLTAPGGGGGVASAAGGVPVPSVLGNNAATSAPTGFNVWGATGTAGAASIAITASIVTSYGGQGDKPPTHHQPLPNTRSKAASNNPARSN